MEEQEQYTKGFNHGYLLARHEPELAAKLKAVSGEQHPYYRGFAGGKEQYEKEVKEWAKGFSRDTPGKDDRTTDKER